MVLLAQKQADCKVSSSTKRNRRPKKRQLFCPAHPEQQIEGNGSSIGDLETTVMEELKLALRDWLGLH